MTWTIKPEWKINKFETEEQFQAACIKIISQDFPMLRGKVWHTPNEWYLPNFNKKDISFVPQPLFDRVVKSIDLFLERCRMMIGSKSKAVGNLSGVPDVLILYFGILYKIELKLPGKSLTDSQKELHPIWNKDCPEIPVKVFYTIEEVHLYCQKIVTDKYKINFSPLENQW